MVTKVMRFKAISSVTYLDNSLPFAKMWFASLNIESQAVVRRYCEKVNFRNNMFLSFYDNIVFCWFLFKDTLK
jgi:hypothetical protein